MNGEPAHIAIDVGEVERIAALGWRGLDEAHLGDWLLRAAGGFTGRSNSALVVGGPPTGDGWLAELVRWYADRGLPPMAQIPLSSAEPVDAMLAAAGWRTHDLVRFLTGDIGSVRNLAATPRACLRQGRLVSNLLAEGVLVSKGLEVVMRLDAQPDDSWLAAYQYRGAVLPAHAREVIRRAGEQTQLCFASLRAPGRDGAVLAVARGALGRDWLGITAVTVADEHRNHGYATRLMFELAAWGEQRGGRAIYLQVAADNVPALKLYARLGFHHHHDYRYRIGPGPDGGSAVVLSGEDGYVPSVAGVP